MTSRIQLGILSMLTASALPASADFIAPTVATYGWNRPTVSGTAATFQAWDAFDSTTGPNAPQVVIGAGTGNPTTMSTGLANLYKGFGGDSTASWTTINAAGTPNAFDSDAANSGSFIPGSGNIYSPGGVVKPRIVIPNNIDGVAGNDPIGFTTILIQVRLQGTDFDPSTIKLFDPVSGTDVSPSSSTPLGSTVVGSMGGPTTIRDQLFVFNLAGNADTYTFNATATGSSLSFDRVAVDTYWSSVPVPEPGLIGVVGLALVVLRRRR